MTVALPAKAEKALKPNRVSKPRIGFLGVGWIGRNRMQAMAATEWGEIAGIADAVSENAVEAGKIAPRAERVKSLDELLDLELDGVVIATPSALHAEQAIRCLERGLAVFCQKPLARTKSETVRVIESAKKSDQLLAVDLSYRFTSGAQRIKQVVESGELGKIFGMDLVFHNAYGPDKDWFYDYRLSGGGCVIDLGIHLVDLAFWLLGDSGMESVSGNLFSNGRKLRAAEAVVEDYANARIELANGPTVNLSCSWKLSAGCDAIIGVSIYGTNGGVKFQNVNGSFYEFRADRYYGTRSEPLASGSEEWGGRAAVDWLKRLTEGERYDCRVETLIQVSEALDRIYGRE